MPEWLSIPPHWLDTLLRVPHVGAWLTGIWLFYLIGLGFWIILQKREPAATLSWLLGLAVLPYVGFLVYYVFGPQRISRQRLRRARHKVSLEPDEHGSEVLELQRLIQATSGLPPSSADSIRLLESGEAKFESLMADIGKASDHVHIEYYIYANDGSGARMRDALTAAAQRGVTVRVLLDALGSKGVPRRYFEAMIAAGGELAWFHPTSTSGVLKFWKRPWINLRTHRKIAVIDGRIAYTGGMNIIDDQLKFRDLHMRIEGQLAREFQQVFVEDWGYATASREFISSVARGTPRLPSGPILAQAVPSGPDSPWQTILRAQVTAIHSATRRVWMTTPYFVPGEAALMALSSAALAGLDVRLLVPRKADSWLVTFASRSYYDQLMEAGVRIYEFGPELLHAKSLLIDDDLAMVGTANFDHRSFNLNFEVQTLVHDAGFAQSLERYIEAALSSAPRVAWPRPERSLRDRLPEAIARLFSPLL